MLSLPFGTEVDKPLHGGGWGFPIKMWSILMAKFLEQSPELVA
jgi:hypothetical protein